MNGNGKARIIGNEHWDLMKKIKMNNSKNITRDLCSPPLKPQDLWQVDVHIVSP